MGITLGTRITARRDDLGLSMSAAARSAGVNRLTWRAWEKDMSVPESYNHVKIERVLRWERGSVAEVLNGRPPVELADEADSQPDLRDETEREIWAITELSEEVRWAYIIRRRRRLEGRNGDANDGRDTA
ncbi:MAG TPA: hypothetical protein VGX25_13395 [Actinophytocola sp.]|uniref:hypothetical protein n=1 Tax=Actinophytocola sp. TaxID=1872138 RepID=UPI002DDD0B73|nr:hypothetical protein [Actinophytocola sp.]HEV2780378.1 hypothetical protein [Actinophytocola sp.]